MALTGWSGKPPGTELVTTDLKVSGGNGDLSNNLVEGLDDVKHIVLVADL